MRKQGKSHILTETHTKRIIQHQKSNKRHGKRNIALLWMSYCCGLRAKELAAISLDDIYSIKTGKLRDVFSLTSEMTKGKKQRTQYLASKWVTGALSDYLRERKERGEMFDKDAPVFLSQRNLRFSPQTISIVFRKMFDEVGLSKQSSHSGRVSYATTLIQNGVDIKTVSELMGHRSINTTAIYFRTNPVRMKDIAKNLKLL